MLLSKLPIAKDIENITNNSTPPKQPNYKFLIESAYAAITTVANTSIDIIRDYGNNIGDLVYIKVKVTPGVYHKLVFPFRRNLEAVVYKSYPDETVATRYKAILVDPVTSAEGGMANVMTAGELDTLGIMTLTFQLVDAHLEIIRNKLISGIARNVTIKDFLVASTATKLADVKVGGKAYLERIDVREPTNLKEYTHLIVEDGTRLTGLPSYLQKEYGVYSGGIGNYMQTYKEKRTAFIYPLFDTKRFDNDSDYPKLLVYIAPTTLFELSDHTYTEEEDQVKIIAGESAVMTNDGEMEFMDTGVGFRSLDASRVMHEPLEVTKEGVKGDRVKTNYEVAQTCRQDGVNYAPVKSPAINQHTRFSEIAKKNGGLIKIDWRYSDPDLIYPNMPVNVNYSSGEKIKQIKGTVQQVHTFATPGYPSTTTIHIFLEKL